MTRSADQQDRDDRRYMGMALELARRGWGLCAPNPAVGAVIMAGDGEQAELLGRGWTQPGGRPHAETEALRRAGGAAGGATLYVTLEPCAHHGETPPCADALIKAGIVRVVVGTLDPDTRVAGQGLDRLRKAGIEVVEGVLTDAAKWTAAGHILRVTQNRPFVQLKLAVSADGLVAKGTGSPVWVTGPQARARGHLLRAQADAILVGIGTVLADDPSLTCRLPGLEPRAPWPIVLDSNCRLPPGSKLAMRAGAHKVVAVTRIQDPPTPQEQARLRALHDRGVEIWRRPGNAGIPLEGMLQDLARNDVTRLLIEGGPSVATSFIDAGLVDETVIFRGTGLLGAAGIAPLAGRGLEPFEDAAQWLRGASRPLPGGDSISVYQSRATFNKL